MKSVIRSIKNEINNYDEGERLVRELTSNERTPPSTQMLIKLKIMLTDQYQFPTIVRMLFKRLKDYNNIRHVEKSLICIEYLMKHADRKFVRYCQMDKKSISKLQRYRYILGNNNGVPVDYGGNIRKRAKRITDLLDNDQKLKESRAKAQGYSMQFKRQASAASKGKYVQRSNAQNRSTQSAKRSAARTATKPAASNTASSSSQKKKKTKKKKTKKKEATTVSQQPSEPQFESFIDVPADNNSGQQQVQQQQQQSDDLLSGDWWKQEEDPFNGNNEEEFEWFQADDNDMGAQSGVGDDGGAFGFGNDDDFADEQKEEDLDADSWLDTMTNMDNVLDGAIQKKDPNKRNMKGKSMAAMAAANPSKQPIPNSFGTDDFFNQNASSNGNNVSNNNDFDPFGLGTNNNNNNSASSNITSLYNQNGNKNVNGGNNMFGGGYNNGGYNNNMNMNRNMNNNQQSFGYQGKAAINPYNTDPFAGIGGGAGGGPQPANYVPRKKQNDPFAQFGSMK